MFNTPNIQFHIGTKVQNTWETLLKNAKNYQKIIVYSARETLKQAGVPNADHFTDDEVIQYFLPQNSSKASITAQKATQSYIVKGNTYNINKPDPFLVPARQSIVNSILSNNYMTQSEMGAMISGVYAEQYAVDTLSQNLPKSKVGNLAQVGDIINNQLRQLDFYITIPIPKTGAINKNTKTVLKNFGIAIDFKPDITKPFVVTSQGEQADAIQQLNARSEMLQDGFTEMVIGHVIYAKYYAIQPFFYSNKAGKPKILMPADFFRNPANFKAANGSKLYPKRKIVKKDYINSGYTEDELMGMTQDELDEATEVVVETTIKEAMIKYLKVMYHPPGGIGYGGKRYDVSNKRE